MPFSPTDISGLKLWLKADALSLANNDPVGTWTDSSGLGNDATQATAGNKPTYKTNVLNGKAVVEFDGGDWLRSTCSGATKPVSIFAVIKPTNFSTERSIIGSFSNVGFELRPTASEAPAGRLNFLHQGQAQIGYSTGSLTAATWARAAVTYSNVGAFVFYRDGSADGTGTTDRTFSATDTVIGGANGGSTENWLGQMAEVLVYDSVLSSGDRTSVDDYLYNKYFVTPPDPPAVVTGSASSVTDTSAVLEGTVDAGGGATTYYFEYAPTTGYGTEIPAGLDGAAGSGSSPVAVDEAISGLSPSATYHFRLVATNASGTDYGDDATFETTAGPPSPKPLNVREKPSTRLSVLVTTPSGKTARWGADEPKPQNVPSGISFSTTVPGGFDTFDCNLPRKTEVGYGDLERLSDVKVLGAGGQSAWEGRLERAPRQSGDDISVNPQAVGWQAHLEDDKTAAEVYVDRDLSHWEGASNKRKINLLSGGAISSAEDGGVDADTTTGVPALNLTISGTGGAIEFRTEAWYDAGPGSSIASIYYDYISQGTDSGMLGQLGTSSDDIATATSLTSDLLTGTNSSGTGTHIATAYRFAMALFDAASPSEGDHVLALRRVTLWGNHGLTKRGTAPNDGLYASDVIANAVSRWAPLLNFTTGAEGTIKPTVIVIPQMEFRNETTVAEIVSQANRFGLDDWMVWEDRTFHLSPRGSGKKWRARVGPAQLEETGPQVDRIWNGVVVTYQDAAGKTRSVGPTGGLVDTTSASLLDTDPQNPANELGIHRYTVLDMGMLSTSDAAIEVGRRFLEESRSLDTSGQAQLIGHVEDDKGIWRPAWQVRAGDEISFVDASDPSYRRIVKTSYSDDSRTNSIDLDSPPEGLDALLERLGAALNTAVLPAAPVFAGPDRSDYGPGD